MATILIIKTGSTYPEIEAKHGDFDAWFRREAVPIGVDITVWDAVNDPEPDNPGQFQGIVITGSPAMVSDRAQWSESAAQFVSRAAAVEIPLLGVCFGHQLLAYALGGIVDYHPQGREIGTLPVSLMASAKEDILLANLPPHFSAHLTHMQSVIQLPPNAIRLASSQHEATQAFRVGRNAWGVQFHPEFTPGIMQAYVDRLSPRLQEEGFPVQQIRDALHDTPHATQILRRFVRLVNEGYFDSAPD